MRVNDPNLNGIQRNTAEGAALEKSRQTDGIRQGSRAGSGPEDSGSPDSVSLSMLSGHLRALHVDSSQRLQRINKLSAEVATRQYQVDAVELSRRLIDDAMKPTL